MGKGVPAGKMQIDETDHEDDDGADSNAQKAALSRTTRAMGDLIGEVSKASDRLQVEDPWKGYSPERYSMADGDDDMKFDLPPRRHTTRAKVVERTSPVELSKGFRTLGDEDEEE